MDRAWTSLGGPGGLVPSQAIQGIALTSEHSLPGLCRTPIYLAVWLGVNHQVSSSTLERVAPDDSRVLLSFHILGFRTSPNGNKISKSPRSLMHRSRVLLNLHILVCIKITWGCGRLEVTHESAFTKQLRKFHPDGS